jgi:hypothetical protein
MGFSNRKGIAMAGGFKLQAEVPLDVRSRVDTITERDELVTINAAWEGMHVYVGETKKAYEYKGNKTWEEILTGNRYVHPKYTKRDSGLYKIVVDDTGHISDVSSVTKSDITALGIPGANTDTTYDNFKGATSDTNGVNGLVPAPYSGNQSQFLRGDATWATPPDTTYGIAMPSKDGLMSSADKTKLDGIASGANKYTHPTYNAKASGLYKITVDGTGHISGATAVTKADITALGIPGQDTVVTYGEVTTTANGLMTAADKTKLDGIASGATKYVHPTYPEKGLGLYKIQVDVNGHIKSAVAIGKDDITALGIPGQDTTYTVGTESYSGTTKLYTEIGSAIDGTLTQKAIYDNYTGKSTKVNATLSASGWSGTTSPYTNTITISGVTTTNNVEVLIPSTITAAQAESWMAAGILCGSQDTDSITLKAYGDKPSIDIPIECIIRKDI